MKLGTLLHIDASMLGSVVVKLHGFAWQFVGRLPLSTPAEQVKLELFDP